MGGLRGLWGSMEVYETLWEIWGCMGLYEGPGVLWGCMEGLRDLLGCMGLYGDTLSR